MVYRSLLVCIVIGLAQISLRPARADVVNYILDSTQSYVDVTINGVGPDRSQTSGTGVLYLSQTTTPFGLARITGMDVVLDNGLFFDLGFQVTASTTAGDVTIDLLTPGAAGSVSSNQFDQLGNLLGLGGIVSVTDPLGIVGGSQLLDLATLTPNLVDFNGVTLSRLGDVLTLSGTYNISQNIDVGGGNTVPINISGVFVANGVVSVPEPGSMCVLLGALGLAAGRRRRSRIVGH